MNLSVEILKQLSLQDAIHEIFKAFHEILKDIPTDELDQFMKDIMKKCGMLNEIGTEAYNVLMCVLDMEKEYRSTYKS